MPGITVPQRNPAERSLPPPLSRKREKEFALSIAQARPATLCSKYNNGWFRVGEAKLKRGGSHDVSTDVPGIAPGFPQDHGARHPGHRDRRAAPRRRAQSALPAARELVHQALRRFRPED